MLGITRYIHDVLQRGQSICIPESRSGLRKKSAENGLAIGRYTDLLLQRVVKKGIKLSATDFKHRRARWILAALTKANVRIIEAQKSVTRGNIKTHIDLVGEVHGQLVSIEIKTTQHTIKDFQAKHSLKCSKNPVLVNGLPNTIAVIYALQAAFGALALGTTAKACVVVGAQDAARVFWVDRTYMNPILFPEPHERGPRRHTQKQNTPFHDWPKGTSLTVLNKHLEKWHISDIHRSGPASGYGTLHGSRVIIGLLAQASEKKRQKAANNLRKITLDYLKSVQTTHPGFQTICAVLICATPPGFTCLPVLRPVRGSA